MPDLTSDAKVKRNLLNSLAESCEFGALKDKLIRDRIVIGIRDKVLSKRMQVDPNLTLDKAKWEV